ncbi:MAG: DinB family protein [Ignavibacteria bacterium]|nr:DinB family protein [Ignavibacteria bacterium]
MNRKNTGNIAKAKKLLKDHYNGNPWIDSTIAGTLKQITAKQAAAKRGGFNSIWQIVNHMILWRTALIGRVMDKPVAHPDNNYIAEIKDTSAAAWKDTIKQFERSQKGIMKFLGSSEDKLLEKVSPSSGYSYFELVMSIVIHDSYHLGQIVLIKKMIEAGREVP